MFESFCCKCKKSRHPKGYLDFLGVVVIIDTILSSSLENVPPPVNIVPYGIFLYPSTNFCTPSDKSVPQEVPGILGVSVRQIGFVNQVFHLREVGHKKVTSHTNFLFGIFLQRWHQMLHTENIQTVSHSLEYLQCGKNPFV